MEQNKIVEYIKNFELSKDQMKFVESIIGGLESDASNWLISEFVKIVLDSRSEKPHSITDAWNKVEFILPVLRKKLDMIWHTCWSCAGTESENHCDKFDIDMSAEHFTMKNPCKEYKFDGILDE